MIGMKRSLLFWVYFCVAIILGIYFASRIVLVGMGHGKNATIHSISILAESGGYDLLAVETAAKSGLGVQVNALDLTILNNRIRAVPGVRDVATRRMPNGTLRVLVQMHQTIAQWTDGEAFYPLAADGTTIKIPSDTRSSDAIVFRGMLPDDISNITNATQSIASLIDYLEWIENRRWNIITKDGITIMLPENDSVATVRELISLNDKKNILGRDIKTIDMRDSARILIK